MQSPGAQSRQPRSPAITLTGPVDKDAPLLLRTAAALAYPDGTMTKSGLRREAKRGRLVIERTANKDYTTLQAIEDMRAQCRVSAKASGSGSAPNGEPRASSIRERAGSSSTDQGISAQAALRMKLQGPKSA